MFLLVRDLFGNPSPNSETLQHIAHNPVRLVRMMVLGITNGTLSEEPGRRGLALDRFQAGRSPLVSSLIIVPFRRAWHLLLFFKPGTRQTVWAFGTSSQTLLA